jgi:hypothetical protein
MSIQKKFTVRYKSDGHVRFDIPEQICGKTSANIVTTRILDIEGVYKVTLFSKQKKLSIRFQEVTCTFNQLATQLFHLLSALEQKGLLLPPAIKDISTSQKKPSRNNLKSKFKNLKATQWVSEKYGDAKETMQAAKTITKLGLKKPKLFTQDPEKAIIDFLNDILVLYLIKLHWTRITQEWIPKPWLFRYQWTAVFYLFYLLIRSRKPK